jgi:hypothetical protein
MSTSMDSYTSYPWHARHSIADKVAMWYVSDLHNMLAMNGDAHDVESVWPIIVIKQSKRALDNYDNPNILLTITEAPNRVGSRPSFF